MGDFYTCIIEATVHDGAWVIAKLLFHLSTLCNMEKRCYCVAFLTAYMPLLACSCPFVSVRARQPVSASLFPSAAFRTLITSQYVCFMLCRALGGVVALLERLVRKRSPSKPPCQPDALETWKVGVYVPYLLLSASSNYPELGRSLCLAFQLILQPAVSVLTSFFSVASKLRPHFLC